MPKDQWRREAARVSSHKVKSRPHQRNLKLPNPRLIPAGSSVLIRKRGSEPFRQYKTTEDIEFEKFVSATKKALLIEYRGYHIWVSKAILVIQR